jgi:hypothetical protein
LYWIFEGSEDRGVTYYAFRHDLLAGFALGDVVRAGLDAAGNLTLTTLCQHWDAPHGNASLLTRGVSQGWGFSVPPGVDEQTLDPLAELSRRFDPLPTDRMDMHYFVHFAYWLVPHEQVLTQGGLSITDAQRAQATTQVQALQQALAAWLVLHPEARRSLVWHDRVRGNVLKAGPDAIQFDVEVQTDDMTEAEQVKAALGQVAGGAVPEVNTLDMAALREQARQRQAVNPPPGATSSSTMQ